jgi:16S rRNA (cytidine1402-2'-O)-methyltransferase
MLYIVATPIGNLQDITYRAVDVLKTVDMIACEDTRHTKILLDHYGITTRTTSFFQHNRFIKGEYLTGLLKEGSNIALVSDAGMPGGAGSGIHPDQYGDPGGNPDTVIPGATALINGLVLSGKPAHRFYFEGFLPPKPGARRNRLTELLRLDCTIVFYESCHRIQAMLETPPKSFGQTNRCHPRTYKEVRRSHPRNAVRSPGKAFAQARPGRVCGDIVRKRFQNNPPDILKPLIIPLYLY